MIRKGGNPALRTKIYAAAARPEEILPNPTNHIFLVFLRNFIKIPDMGPDAKTPALPPWSDFVLPRGGFDFDTLATKKAMAVNVYGIRIMVLVGIGANDFPNVRWSKNPAPANLSIQSEQRIVVVPLCQAPPFSPSLSTSTFIGKFHRRSLNHTFKYMSISSWARQSSSMSVPSSGTPGVVDGSDILWSNNILTGHDVEQKLHVYLIWSNTILA